MEKRKVPQIKKFRPLFFILSLSLASYISEKSRRIPSFTLGQKEYYFCLHHCDFKVHLQIQKKERPHIR